MARDTRFAYQVGTLIVFGSYVGEKDPIGDIDVAIRLVPRQTDWDEHCAFRTQLIEDELARGRRFQNLTEQVCWPTTHAMRYLRGRDYALSFVDLLAHRAMLIDNAHQALIGSVHDE